MELCKHLKGVYQNEIASGNEILAIATLFSNDFKLEVNFKRILTTENIPDTLLCIEETACPWIPNQKHVICEDCKMSLGFPLANDQRDTYAPPPNTSPDPLVIAAADTVIWPDDYHKIEIVPTEKYREKFK